MNDNATDQSRTRRGRRTTDKPQEAAPDPFAVIEKLVAENAELKDRVLRALAETENMRRRSEKEAADARTYAVTAFARDLLSVVDNLERALGSLTEEQRATRRRGDEGADRGRRTDLARSDRPCSAATASSGSTPRARSSTRISIRRCSRRPDETVPSGAVSQVVQSGWKIGERVLRPALVGVSKGGVKAAPPQG